MAKHCDMLATEIRLKRFLKYDLSALVQDSTEKDWLACWKERLGNPDGTPRQVLQAYVEELDITGARLNEAMEWDCWVDDDYNLPSDDE